MSLGTSNANESLHSVIWRRAPKAVFSSRKTEDCHCRANCTIQQGCPDVDRCDDGRCPSGWITNDSAMQMQQPTWNQNQAGRVELS